MSFVFFFCVPGVLLGVLGVLLGVLGVLLGELGVFWRAECFAWRICCLFGLFVFFCVLCVLLGVLVVFFSTLYKKKQGFWPRKESLTIVHGPTINLILIF